MRLRPWVLAAMCMASAAHAEDWLAANVRCASVDGMLPCRIPEGASVSFGGRRLQSGYFGGGMHVGLIEVRKRPAGVGAKAPPTDLHEVP